MEAFYDILIYVNCLPILVGIIYWRFFKLPTKIYFVGNIFLQFFALTSVIFSYFHKNTHFLFYVNNIFTVLIFALFYQNILRFKNYFLLFIPTFILGFIFIDFYKNGITEYFVLPMLLIELSILPFAIILYRKNITDKTLKLLNLGTIIYTSIDIIINLMTLIFYHYFQGKAFDLIFLGISPLNGLCLSAFQSYAYFLASKQTQPSFDNNPNFS